MEALFGGIAIIVIVLLVVALSRNFFRFPNNADQGDLPSLPMTALQKRAWLGLSLGIIVTAILGYLIYQQGPTEFFDNADMRLVFYALLAGGAAAWSIVYSVTKQRGDVPLDERDEGILQRAPGVQSGLILISLAAWAIALTEYYRDEGSIPVIFAMLIFWSSWMMHIVGLAVGVLIGYRRANTDA